MTKRQAQSGASVVNEAVRLKAAVTLDEVRARDIYARRTPPQKGGANWGVAAQKAFDGHPKMLIAMLKEPAIPIDLIGREFLLHVVQMSARGKSVLRSRPGRANAIDDFDLTVIKRFIDVVRKSSTRAATGEQMRWLANRYNVTTKTLYSRLRKLK